MNLHNDEMFETIKEIISKVTKINPNEINLESKLYDGLLIDPLYATELKLLVENAFNVKIDDIEILNVTTVQEIIEVVNEYLDFPMDY